MAMEIKIYGRPPCMHLSVSRHVTDSRFGRAQRTKSFNENKLELGK